MSNNRPNFIDLGSGSGPLYSMTSPRPLASPRLHVAGEIPPALSPLDAFAAQSRMLAKQLDNSMTEGKRMSRLPPLTIERSFSQQNRPGLFRSFSDSPEVMEQSATSDDGPGMRMELESPSDRPMSVHPHLSGGPFILPPTAPSRLDDVAEEPTRGRGSSNPQPQSQDFGARREQSPGMIEPKQTQFHEEVSPSYFRSRQSMEPMRQRGPPPTRNIDVTKNRVPEQKGLAPPKSPQPSRSLIGPRAPSVRSASGDSEEDSAASVNASYLSRPRKMSSSSAMSTSPNSPYLQPFPRSPSACSDASVGGARLPRPAYNFSRPMSRGSGPVADGPSRQGSSDSQAYVFVDDTVHTPVSMHSEDLESLTHPSGAPSYVYSRFSLPRGKMLQRNSFVFEDQPTVSAQWEQPTTSASNVELTGKNSSKVPPSPPSRPATAGQVKISLDQPVLSPVASRPPAERSANYQHSHKSPPSLGPPDSTANSKTIKSQPSSRSLTSESTVKTRSQHSIAPSAEGSAEEHLAKGIECHERGSLNESTYHLRIAARQNHPTAMLLYALACRHGWGMRANQAEGVQWLRKAADFASLEVADDEEEIKGGKPVDFLEKKTRKAQFALSIYELGVSHMNGWGIEQDKSLALRCFEIAGCEYTHSSSVL